MNSKMNSKSNNKLIVMILMAVIALMIFVPMFALRGAEFGGSDDAGSQMIETITGEYEPWFTPVLETVIGGELPGELESLFFCLQTGIGVGVVCFIMGKLVERKKWMDKQGGEECEKVY